MWTVRSVCKRKTINGSELSDYMVGFNLLRLDSGYVHGLGKMGNYYPLGLGFDFQWLFQQDDGLEQVAPCAFGPVMH
jgi:hypothetical protein